LDFESSGDGSSLNRGEYVRYQWYNKYGITIEANAATGSGFTPDKQARIFDTSNPGTSDETGAPDLGTPNENCPAFQV
jgi:hypothetical protein